MNKVGNGALEVREGNLSNTPEGLAIQWLDWLISVKGRQKRTGEAYSLVLRQWLQWCEQRGIDPLAPEVTDLEEFTLRTRTRQAKGRVGSAATRRTEVVALRQWFEWLVRRGYVTHDPTVDLEAPSVKAGLPKPISNDEHWRRLITADMPDRMRLALYLGYYVGLRREEITSLTGSQITDTHIERFVRKGGGDDTLPWRSMIEVVEEKIPEVVPEPGRFQELLLRQAREVRSERLTYKDGHQIYKGLRALCQKLGLPHYTPHQLRHSCASNLVNRAHVPLHIVSSLLNHSSIDMTRRYVRAGGDELDRWRRSLMAR